MEALRAAVATQGREREVAAQAQARLAAAKKQMKELEWSSEVRCAATVLFLGSHFSACSAGLLCKLPGCVYVTGCICNAQTQQGDPVVEGLTE